MAVFLAGYRNGARRQRDSKGTRTPLYLPEPAWFLDRVQTYSDPDLLRRLGSGGGPAGIQHANVVGLVVLGRGITYSGNLTPFDLESDLLWRYVGRPESCYTVEVQRFFSPEAPVAIYARQSDCQGISSTKVNLQDWIFFPATDVDLDCFNLLDDALHAVGDRDEIPVLWVPEVILSLIKAGKWKSLLFHYSRTSHRSTGNGLLNVLRKIQDRMNWPSREEISRLWNCRRQFHQPPCMPLTEQSASFLIQKIREHSSVLLSGASDAGGVVDPGAIEEQQIKLEEALEGLQVFSQAMSKEHVSRLPKSAMSSTLIIDSIRAARHLRNRGQLAMIKSAVIDSFVPSHLQSFARSIMFQPASKASVSRYQV